MGIRTPRTRSAQWWAEAVLPMIQGLLGWLAVDLTLWIASLEVHACRPLAFACTQSGFLLMLGVLGLSSWVSHRTRVEASRGFTSTRFAYRDLPEVAPGTSTVIRNPGQPFLTDDDYFAALAAARSHGDLVDSSLRPRSPLQWILVPAFTITLGLLTVIAMLAFKGEFSPTYPVAFAIGMSLPATFLVLRTRTYGDSSGG